MPTTAVLTDVDVVTAEVFIAAPAERVIAALTISSQVPQWWGREGVYVTKRWEGDVRAGGEWRQHGENGAGQPFLAAGEFLFVDLPRRFSYTWQASWTGDLTTKVEWKFEECRAGTMVSLRHSGFAGSGAAEAYEQGWKRALPWLRDYVETAEEAGVVSGYAPVNGLKMHYQIEGAGKPLVYIPPVFGYAGVNTFPSLAKIRQVISVDLQGHGRTADIDDRPITFEQHAEDVVALMKHLGIPKADFFGESFGGLVATIIAVRHPEMVDRVATYGSVFGKFQDAFKPEMLATQLSLTPEAKGIQFQRENYKKVAADPEYWPKIWLKVYSAQWNGFTHEDLSWVQAPVLIAVGDHDFVRLEHSLEAFKTMPSAELAVIPDAGHFVLNVEPDKVMPTIEKFFSSPVNKVPFATTETGYHPGETR